MKNKNLKFLTSKIDSFSFKEGKLINQQYKIIRMLGSGLEGEVYLVEELHTKILRAIKFFKPHRNIKNKNAKLYSKKLHKLRNCQAILQYVSMGEMIYWGRQIFFLVSEYLEGDTLSKYLSKQKGKRIDSFQSILLLHSLVSGLQEVHAEKEYHGDLHLDNIIIERYGLGYNVKVLDMFYHGKSSSQDYKDDLCDVIRVFYDILGGKNHYNKHQDHVRFICAGLKKNLIIKRFKNMSFLKYYLENLKW